MAATEPQFPRQYNPLCCHLSQYNRCASDRYLILLNDINGKLVYRSENVLDGQWTKEVNIASLPAGTYSLTIATKKGVRTASVIKQ